MTQDRKGKKKDGDKPAGPTYELHYDTAPLTALDVSIESLTKEYKESQKQNATDTQRKYRLDRNVAIGVGLYTIISAGIFVVGGVQVCISRDSEKRQLRAYVTLSQIELQCPRCDKPETLTLENVIPQTAPTKAALVAPGAFVTLRFENSGQTPGYDVDSDVTVDPIPKKLLINDSDLPDDFKFTEMIDVAKPARPVISRDTPILMSAPINSLVVMTVLGKPIDTRLKLLVPDPVVIFAFGHFDYTDVFKERHHSLFCVYFSPPTEWESAHWVFCPKHNEHD